MDKKEKIAKKVVTFFALAVVAICQAGDKVMKYSDESKGNEDLIYIYKFSVEPTKLSYDSAVAVACLQGIINRERPQLYIMPSENSKAEYWLDILSGQGEWLSNKKRVEVSDLDALVKLAGNKLKGVVIWDPQVPATINVATTIAGIKDAVVLSPELSDKYLSKWGLPILEDLRGQFDGSISGSAKNDAYRWAIKEYLSKGLCSSRLFCSFEDAAKFRNLGDIKYVVCRDRAVKERAFVFDLSPWADEKPKDDPDQPLGTDLKTYMMILEEMLRQSAGKYMTEMTGFFPFWKYSNEPGPSKYSPAATEWELVYLFSSYNCFQNAIPENSYNQSFHNYAPFSKLKQRRPELKTKVENKDYICILMGDYDSSMTLYEFLPKFWNDPNRGKIPLAWCINPNLIEIYPDLISYYYRTATKNDFFTADAGAAGYMNPNRIRSEYLPLFVQHNKKFFELADMTIAPMVQDWQEPTAAVKDAFVQFAPDGYGSLILDFHIDTIKPKIISCKPQVWKNMPIMEELNEACFCKDSKERAEIIYNTIQAKGAATKPGFYLLRIVWSSPSEVVEALKILKDSHSDLNFEVIDPYNFFALFRQHMQSTAKDAENK